MIFFRVSAYFLLLIFVARETGPATVITLALVAAGLESVILIVRRLHDFLQTLDRISRSEH